MFIYISVNFNVKMNSKQTFSPDLAVAGYLSNWKIGRVSTRRRRDTANNGTCGTYPVNR